MSVYSDLVISSTPVLYWRFTETSGTTFADLSGNSLGAAVGGHSGVTLGGSSAIAAESNASISISNDEVNLSNATSTLPNLGSNFTLEMWYGPTSNLYGYIMARGLDAYTAAIYHYGYNFWLRDFYGGGGGGIAHKIAGGFKIGNVVYEVQSPGALSTSQTFFHLALVRSSRYLYLYVDGSLVASRSDCTTGPTNTPNTSPAGLPLQIGGGYAAGGGGRYDEVAIYNSALSATTVMDHYHEGVRLSPNVPVGLRCDLYGGV